MQVFQNSALLVVVSFKAGAAAQEGDLVAYMNKLLQYHKSAGAGSFASRHMYIVCLLCESVHAGV